jgi:hypothetical protein
VGEACGQMTRARVGGSAQATGTMKQGVLRLREGLGEGLWGLHTGNNRWEDFFYHYEPLRSIWSTILHPDIHTKSNGYKKGEVDSFVELRGASDG